MPGLSEGDETLAEEKQKNFCERNFYASINIRHSCTKLGNTVKLSLSRKLQEHTPHIFPSEILV